MDQVRRPNRSLRKARSWRRRNEYDWTRRASGLPSDRTNRSVVRPIRTSRARSKAAVRSARWPA